MRFKLPLHGRSHSSGGSDPITGYIAFDNHNGDDDDHYLYVAATGTVPTTTVGLYLNAAGMRFLSRNLDVTWDSTRVFTVNVTDGFDVVSDKTVAIDAVGSTPTHGITLDGATVIKLSTVGNHFGINDHLNNEIFRVDEDGTITGSAGVIDGGGP